MTTRVILVDDHEEMRQVVREIIESDGQIEVAGEAGDGSEGIAMVDELEPDVVIMDMAMPSASGIEATAAIMSRHPHVKVVALSKYSNKQIVEGAINAGVAGYVLKYCAAEELLPAIHAACQGKSYLGNWLER